MTSALEILENHLKGLRREIAETQVAIKAIKSSSRSSLEVAVSKSRTTLDNLEDEERVLKYLATHGATDGWVTRNQLTQDTGIPSHRISIALDSLEAEGKAQRDPKKKRYQRIRVIHDTRQKLASPKRKYTVGEDKIKAVRDLIYQTALEFDSFTVQDVKNKVSFRESTVRHALAKLVERGELVREEPSGPGMAAKYHTPEDELWGE